MRALTALTAAMLALAVPGAPRAEDLVLEPRQVTDWKAVYGRIEARDQIPARARLGGTLVRLAVSEGDMVEAGQILGEVEDAKIAFQLGAIDAQLQALDSQLANARTELGRGEELLSRGVTTAQRLDALRTQVDVLVNQIAAQRASRRVVEQQAAEGAVLAPLAGRVLAVPVTAGAVVMPGEVVAMIGGGGVFVRLSVPERHARGLAEGDSIGIGTEAGAAEGRLAKVYPQIQNGRVIADVEVAGLDDSFVDARVLVRLPLARRSALLVPSDAVVTRAGLDYVAVRAPDDPARVVERVVVPGERIELDGVAMTEIVSGLAAGDRVVRHDD